MKLKTFLSVMIICAVVISCSDDNDPKPFSISFNPEVYDAVFYTSGETMPATGPLDGSVEVSLQPGASPEFSYNTASHTVQWTKLLPLGENTVTVVAKRGQEEATATLTINNIFQGYFSGYYQLNGSPIQHAYTLQFNSDGTVGVQDVDNGYEGSGTWQRDGDTITASYVIGNFGAILNIAGVLHYNTTEAYVEGLYYLDNGDTIPDGIFRVDIQ